jgi:hypothetical protein
MWLPVLIIVKEQDSNADEDGSMRDWFGIFLRATPAKTELHDLSNIWCRSATWQLTFTRKDGSTLYEYDDVEATCDAY